MKPEGSLPHQQERATSLYPEPHHSSPYPLSLLLNIHFNITFPLRLGFHSGLSGFPTQTLYTHLLSPLCAMFK